MAKITLNPLPSIFLLIKSYFIGFNSDFNISRPWLIRENDISYWFSRSTISMLVIIKWYEAFVGKNKPVVWLPDYFCNEPVNFLNDFGYSFIYYPINEAMTPNWNVCEELAVKQKPEIFILVHYFGECNDVDSAKTFCNKFQSILVEDAAHVMVPYSDIGKYGDFIFYSQHKLFAIPDGSLLVQKKKSKTMNQLSTKDPARVLDEICCSFPNKKPSVMHWIIKRILQKLLPDFIWLNKMKNNNYKQLKIKYKPFQSILGKHLLYSQIDKISDYGIQRKINDSAIKVGFDEDNLEVKYIPYMTKFRFLDKKDAERFYALKGSPFTKWPDLPYKVDSNSTPYSLPKYFKDIFLFAPIHQSVNIVAINRMRKMLQFNKLENTSEFTLTPFELSVNEWDDYISESGLSNYLQSWEYGNAKKEIEGWKLERVIIKRNNKIIGFYQMLVKKIGPISLCRINRGPLFNNNYSQKTKYYVLSLIKNKYNILKGYIVIFTPEFYCDPQNIAILNLLNYKKKGQVKWNSIVVNLSESEANLRGNLNGKWRNQLKKAETHNMKINIGSSASLFNWLMKQYKTMQIDKSFIGPKAGLYESIFKQNPNKLIIFQACYDDNPVAGQMYIIHGKTSTYLVGWSSDQGRKKHAHNFLIWNAMLQMKNYKINWFDLGGIDEIKVPGITKFKRGVNGNDFTLTGDWYIY